MVQVDSKKAVEPKEEVCLLPPVKSSILDKRKGVTYLVGKSIGEGGFAKCYEAKVANTGDYVCCKTLWKAKLKRDSDRLRARTEVAIHRKMNHPNIVKFYSASEDDDYVYIFMEICRLGTLKDLLHRRKALTEPEVRYYLLQLLSAIEYLMTCHVIHRDLKLANIFIAEDMTLRIGDFGLAGMLLEGQDRKTTRCGTPNYTAPEVLDQDGHSYEVDMWALGIITYTLLIGVPPFQTKGGLKEIYLKIRTVDLHFPAEPKISEEAKDIVTMILRANPNERPNFQQVRDHPFFRAHTLTSLPEKPLNLCQSSPTLTVPPKRRECTPHKKSKFGQSPIRSPKVISPAPLPPAQASLQASPRQAEAENRPPRLANPRLSVFEAIIDKYNHIKQCLALDQSLAEIESQIGKADLTIPNFISKWISHEAKYGFVYEFMDGTMGVLFNDLCTLTATPDRENLEYIKCPGNQSVIAARYTKAEFQKSYPEKMALFERFAEEIKSTPPAILDAATCAALPPTLLTPASFPASNSTRPYLCYLTKVNKSKHAIFVRLSNGAVQMNLADDNKFLLSDKGRCLVVIPKKGTAIHTYSLVDILYRHDRSSKAGRAIDPSLHALHTRLLYFMDILTLLVERSQAKKGLQPIKATLSANV
ncbi:Cell cycle serine/threonine-protein kinase cdc5/MSD2 [Massospora cicadina]|nr:Cell cycle serine/threonine-protein kinase cdc5/MSD2 [Massospora cicadina]